MTGATMHSKPIVVAVDGSQESAAALAWAIGRAAGTGERLRAVTTYEQPFPANDVAGDYWRDLLAAKRAARSRAEIAIIDVLGHTDVDHVLHMGPVERVLADLSPEASLVVVGNRPSATWWGRLRGSVAERIRDTAACPVVSVPFGAPLVDEPIAA